uniref:Retinol dehydrogenase 7 n=1 Tax=Rhabditophanes sp. KR3021 TaxID=114890 RepID=A0AC35UB11_9BILA
MIELVNWWYLVPIIPIFYFLFRRLVLERFELSDSKGKYVFVTGCDSGFGKLLVSELLKKEMNVVAGCFTESGKCDLIKENIGSTGELYVVILDVTKQESVQEVFKFVESLMSQKNTTLWSVVNNAGANIFKGPNDWYTVEDFENSIDINLVGPIRICQTFTPLLKKSKGRFVTMISCSGRIHGFWLGPYTTAKFGLEGYMDNLRLDMQIFGIGVSVLEPGCFKTPLTEDKGLECRVNKTWDSLSEDIKADYGLQFKDNLISSWHSGVNIIASRNLYTVVDNYVHAICATFPRKRYICGVDAWLLFLPLSYLPSTIQDLLLTFIFNLNPGPSLLPAFKCSERVTSELNNNSSTKKKVL